MARRRRRKRRSEVTPLHWVNLLLYFVALIVVLVGVSYLGDSTASCFMDVSAPPEQPAPSSAPMPAEPPPQGN